MRFQGRVQPVLTGGLFRNDRRKIGRCRWLNHLASVRTGTRWANRFRRSVRPSRVDVPKRLGSQNWQSSSIPIAAAARMPMVASISPGSIQFPNSSSCIVPMSKSRLRRKTSYSTQVPRKRSWASLSPIIASVRFRAVEVPKRAFPAATATGSSKLSRFSSICSIWT